MSVQEMKNQSFPNYLLNDWKLTALESLKGKPLDCLQTDTYESILLKPLYSKKDEKISTDYPGGSDYKRGLHTLGYITNKWKIAQRIAYTSQQELVNNLKVAIERGQTAYSFEPADSLFPLKDDLVQFLIEQSKIPFAINAKDYFKKMLNELSGQAGIEKERILGFIGFDPLSTFILKGSMPGDVDGFFNGWATDIEQYNERFPHLKTILVDLSTYHNGGANAVQELGIACSTGVFYLQQLLEKGMELHEILSKMIFHFSIGSNFFMEIAKIRAARILWNKIAEVYGAKMEYRGMDISAETSAFTKTMLDKHVNILRAGNEAFAAVLGGVQYLHVTPFDEESHFSERLARNTQHILQEEAHLQHVVDPAGGSWYIESLTREIAEKAWAFFKTIEAKGGIVPTIQSNFIQKEIQAINEKRKQDILTRKSSIIGTNVYANLDEKITNSIVASEEQKLGVEIRKIPQVRLSVPFEELRMKAASFKEKPVVGLICIGKQKDFKARADFMKGFLAAGGILGKESGPISSSTLMIDFVKECQTKYFCLCSSNEIYESLGFEVLPSFLEKFPSYHLYFAGLPASEHQSKWLQGGIRTFIHTKSNGHEILKTILSEMEEDWDEA